MGGVDRSVCDGNILCFADQLRWETNPARQETLKRILLREENRLGVSEEHFRIAERKLMDGAWLIARQKQLIAEIKSRKGDTARQRWLRGPAQRQGPSGCLALSRRRRPTRCVARPRQELQ
jgi:hypothetical protein